MNVLSLEFLQQWIEALWATLCETGPFLVIGLLFAGMLHVWVPARVIRWAVGGRGWWGAIRGALLGIPLPLCSCGVVPTALTLRRQGASLSATTAFTIATPETSIDTLAITAAMMPLAFLGVRPIAALLLAVIVGVIVECWSVPKPTPLSNIDQKWESAEICKVCGLTAKEDHGHGVISQLRAVMSYAFGTFFDDIGMWLAIGFVIAAFMEVALPNEVLSGGWWGDHPSFQVLMAMILSIPLYSCATATTPLAAVLLTKGLNPGAALAILLTGPASNLGTVFAFIKVLGRRATVIYYTSLFCLCWIFGILMNLLWPVFARFPSLVKVATGSHFEGMMHVIPHWMEAAAASIVLILICKILVFRIVKAMRPADTCH